MGRGPTGLCRRHLRDAEAVGVAPGRVGGLLGPMLLHDPSFVTACRVGVPMKRPIPLEAVRREAGNVGNLCCYLGDKAVQRAIHEALNGGST